jgi:hypothetical protein
MKTFTSFAYTCEAYEAFGERYPDKRVSIETECSDLDAHELLDLFKDFMVGCGYAEKSFYDACTRASKENPYAESRNGPKLGQTDKIWHSGGYDNPQKTDEISHSWQNIHTPEEDRPHH